MIRVYDVPVVDLFSREADEKLDIAIRSLKASLISTITLDEKTDLRSPNCNASERRLFSEAIDGQPISSRGAQLLDSGRFTQETTPLKSPGVSVSMA